MENVFTHLVQGLLQEGYQISVITSRFAPDLAQEEIRKGIHIYRCGKGRISFFFSCFWLAFQVLRKHPEIALLHASTYTAGIPASLLGAWFGKKRVLTVHEIFGKLWKGFKPRYSRWIFQLFEWLLFQVPYEAYHCVSLYTLNSLRIQYGIADSLLHLIPNGVDTHFWNPQAVSLAEQKALRKQYGRGNAPVALYYGHAGISKGLAPLLAALPDIQQEFPDLHWVFNLIPSKRTSEFAERIARFPQTTLLLGLSQRDLRQLVASVDLVVAPSLAEGFGSVHTEVCAMQKPLLTTQVAAIPEVVSGEVIFVKPASAQEILAGVRRRTEKKS